MLFAVRNWTEHSDLKKKPILGYHIFSPVMWICFQFLQRGYTSTSVRSVVLHTLNRARFSVAVESFLKTGQVPSLQEGNMQEKIFSFPWLKDRPVILGSRFRDAFQDPGAFLAIEPLFEKERYIVTYNPSKGKVYALLKDQAKSDDILKAAFHAHVLLHFIHSADNSLSSRSQHEHLMPAATDFELHIAESCKMVSASYRHFKNNAAEQEEFNGVITSGLIVGCKLLEPANASSGQFHAVKELNPKWSEPDACLTPLKGWRMSDSLLNPGRARLH
ncbi:hypothetical protein Godav_013579 [Gossypium davidsonii]|uniref:Root UVB sensitive protein C-terminal domain-containing protein n=1 Tax=Gossypium davidsonii TaxID=34287 RepID=A0A7J8RGU4_GOSDV|nr:hypothetical protein [Gossypium davidsonii]